MRHGSGGTRRPLPFAILETAVRHRVIGSVILIYMVSSPAVILLNNHIMNALGFKYPIFLSGLGQLSTSIGARVYARVAAEWRPVAKEHSPKGQTIGWHNLSARDARCVVVVSAASSASLVCGQYPYLYLSVAFIQMMKAFSPTVMLAMLLLMRMERYRTDTMLSVVGITVFTVVASAGEIHFRPIGVLFMIVSSLSDSLRLVLIQLMGQRGMTSDSILCLVSPMSTSLVLLASSLLEWRSMLEQGGTRIVRENPWCFASACASGIVINATTTLIVSRVSALSMKSMAMARNAMLVVFAAVVMGEEVTAVQLLGYCGMLVCFVAYVFTKHVTMGEAPTAECRTPASPPPVDVESLPVIRS